MSAGELRERVTFGKRPSTDDGYGNEEGSWQDQFTVAARIQPLKGGEGVQAARLAGTQPVIIRVRWSADTVLIAPAWRAVDARSSIQYQIKSIMNADEKKKYLDILAEAGGAVG